MSLWAVMRSNSASERRSSAELRSKFIFIGRVDQRPRVLSRDGEPSHAGSLAQRHWTPPPLMVNFGLMVELER